MARPFLPGEPRAYRRRQIGSEERKVEWLGLRGKGALVAGAGGIGGAAALALAEAGADVVVADIDEERLGELARPGVRTLVADLSDATGARDCVTRADALLGRLDVFVHAIGVNDRRPVLDTPDDVWRAITAVNVDSAFRTGKAAGELMVARGYGRIVFLSSVSGLLAHPHHAPYAAGKGAVNQLARVMAREWAASGVTVNAVAPGYTETGLTHAHLEKPGVRDGLTALVPAGRLGTPEDLTGPILFLCSDQAAFVTGHVLYADGGRTLV
ncbi:SDR family oxidoreductase [Amycolatopsis sp. A133]|uniref:SDR family NAD(P)-dependent oxidoreductase n=1 Tax=Amycolatopsis sp. A133 TaxID=3064472 RepID=UPI0027F1DABE|nr:SDR family oxidoreductase [Amycolatopsis sp. A133]MDQ7810959.1 SDR family oxidoreductase [Amycolatopsis sp. A133]